MLPVSSENPIATSFFLFLGIGVATSIQCHGLTLSAFTAFMCHDLDSMLQPRFDVTTSFLLSASLLLGHCSSFHVATSFGCLELSSRPRLNFSGLLIFLLRPINFFNQCNSYRNLKSMSRPDCSSFLLKNLFRPQFHVTTSFMLPAILILVATTFS